MFDLEAAIKSWRRDAESNWTGANAALDELEDHLREEIAALTRAGHAERDAWNLATSKLGDPAVIGDEFAKVDRLSALDRWTFAVLLTTAAALVVVAFSAIFVMRGQVMQNDPVLSLHVVTITLGYLAGLFAAVIASYETMRNVFSQAPTPALTGITLRVVRVTSIGAAVLTMLGFTFGAIWANNAWGRPFSMDPREIGAIIVAASFIAAAVASRRNALPARAPLTIAIAAGATVLAAWFGVAAYFHNYPPLLTAAILAGLVIMLAVAALSISIRRTPMLPQ